MDTRPNAKEQTELRKSLRNNATAPESILWKRLKGKQVGGIKFRRQYGIGPYVLDFFCTELRLCIELDGEIHSSREEKIHDIQRDQFLESLDIIVKRYSNDVVYQNMDSIIADILMIKGLKKNPKDDELG